MFCTHCGLQLNDEARFCSQCGKGTSRAEPRRDQGYYAPRRLYRLVYDKKIAGVCSGVAKYLDLDVTLVRILVLCGSLLTGVGFLAYLLAWILLPKDYGAARPAQVEYTPTEHPAST